MEGKRFKLESAKIYSPSAVILLVVYAGYILAYLFGYFGFSVGKTLLAATPITVVLLLQHKNGVKGEPYGDFERSLNEVPGHETLTEWLNMGYWTVSERPSPFNMQVLRSCRHRPRLDVRSLKPARVMHIIMIYSLAQGISAALALKVARAACPKSGHVLGWSIIFIPYKHCVEIRQIL